MKARLLIRASAVLTLLLAMTMMVVGVVSRLSSVPQRIPPYNPPGCALPCLAGVTPGETDIDHARAIITGLPGRVNLVNDSALWLQALPDANRVILDFAMTDPRQGRYVKQIEASTYGRGQFTTLGAIIVAGFVPTRVFRKRIAGPDSINVLIVFGTDQQIIVDVGATNIISPDTPIDDLITTAKESGILDDIRLIRHFDDEITWMGFRSVDDYLKATPKQ